MNEYKLPDVGEGLTEGEILQWMVGVGDTVTLNQPIVEVETAKAAVEIPAKWGGVVTRIFHEAGTTVEVGAPIIAIDTDPGAGPVPSAESLAAVEVNPINAPQGTPLARIAVETRNELRFEPCLPAHWPGVPRPAARPLEE